MACYLSGVKEYVLFLLNFCNYYELSTTTTQDRHGSSANVPFPFTTSAIASSPPANPIPPLPILSLLSLLNLARKPSQKRSTTKNRQPNQYTSNPFHPQSVPQTNRLSPGQIRYHLWHPLTPRPLRLSRLRSLRHWTIHRAWQVFQAKQRRERELELQRQYTAMRDACEALRRLGDDGVEGGSNEGRLYRIAMDKTGIWAGVPIEYARCQSDWPSRAGWNHEWRRG
jgi:hypothetical protein